MCQIILKMQLNGCVKMKINSESKIPIDEHFKVSAGPGAGKTYWLVGHIRNVLQNSTKLSQSRKIACITYTNVGVESILEKLGTWSNQVEVSTIHSFLYRHVLKPYSSFLPEKYRLNAEKIAGHDEISVNFDKVSKWIDNHPRKDELVHPFTCNQLLNYRNNMMALGNWLSSLKYDFDEQDNLIIKGDKDKAIYFDDKGETIRLSNKCLEILESNLFEYKKLYWEEGIINHDDVLFFSYKLIEEYPFILKILRSKFPYFFIDEFQDTNPIQYNILKMVGEEETIVGVIGDPAQSIYEFQGANVKQFIEFSLEGLKEYTMVENKRSTNKIIDLLNYIRKDIQQEYYRDDEGDKPAIIVGDCKEAYIRAKELSNNEEVYTLSRKNIIANIMKEEFEGTSIDGNLVNELKKVDNNYFRRHSIISCISAVEYARAGRFKEAMKKLRFLANDTENELEGRKKIINSLYFLVNKYDEYKDCPIISFYDLLKEKLKIEIAGLKKNCGPHKFYSETSYKELAIYIDGEDDKSNHRTIHKAKGIEFNNVMLILEDEKLLDFIFDSDLENNEEHRVYYVAISRARDRIFINVPDLSENNECRLESLFDIIKNL